MKYIYPISSFLSLVMITLVLINDHFPSTFAFIAKGRVLVLILLVIALTLTNVFSPKTETKSTVVRKVLFLVYWVSLSVILYALGGVSTMNISIANPVIWLIMVISIVDIRREWKKLQQPEPSEKAYS